MRNRMSDYLKLGTYIDRLEAKKSLLGGDTVIDCGLSVPHSWRGSYDELSFEPTKNVTINNMLVNAIDAVGCTFEGWKGGEFEMNENTKIHSDAQGCYDCVGITIEDFEEMFYGNPKWEYDR